jgi:hypothetical protein
MTHTSKALHGGRTTGLNWVCVHLNLFRPTDDGTKMEAPGILANTAMTYAVTHVTIICCIDICSSDHRCMSRDVTARALSSFGRQAMGVLTMMIAVPTVMPLINTFSRLVRSIMWAKQHTSANSVHRPLPSFTRAVSIPSMEIRKS